MRQTAKGNTSSSRRMKEVLADSLAVRTALQQLAPPDGASEHLDHGVVDAVTRRNTQIRAVRRQK